MTKLIPNISVRYGLFILATALLSSVSFADTQVKLQSITNALRVTEGYTASVEEWQAASSTNVENAHVIILSNHDHTTDVWIDDVGTSLFSDQDHDGYFGGFSLSFDVDTNWGNRDIYATIYLQLGVNPAEKFHTTEIFTIYSRSGSDVYRVDAELIDNYRAGEYHVQIDIHDAHNGDVLDSVDSGSFRNLRNLPLEAEPHGSSIRTTIITEYAGLSGPLFLVLLAMVAFLRCQNNRRGILSESTLARVTHTQKHYEQLPDTSSKGNRLPF